MRRLYQFLAGILAIIFFLWGISAYMQSRTGNVSDKLVIYNWGAVSYTHLRAHET